MSEPEFTSVGKRGAIHRDPIAMALFLFMTFVLLQWMTQPGGPLVGCAQCQSGVGQFFSPGNKSTSWMLYLVVPITMAMMVTWLTDKLADEDEGHAGELARELMRIAPQQGLFGPSGAIRTAALRGTREEFSKLAEVEAAR